MPWKKREFLPTKSGIYRELGPGGVVTFSEKVPFTSIVSQQTYSEDHDWPEGASSGANVGGPFYTKRRQSYVDSGSARMQWRYSGGSGWDYSGPVGLGMLGLGGFPINGPQYEASDLATLHAQGTKAIALADPTKSEANVAQMIGELKKDGLPTIPGLQSMHHQARDFRDLGGEYLNVQFGWKPFISDVKSTLSAARDHEKILRNLQRNSGRNIRRRVDLPSESITTREDVGNFYAAPLNGGLWKVIQRPATKTTTVTKKRWFSGAFTYHLDPGKTALGKAKRISQEANHLFGIGLTPETLWELAPWSWAVDWVGNTGDVIHNLSSALQYGTVLRYGYIMETVETTMIYEASGFVTLNDEKKDLAAVYKQTVKTREPASPFGFGLTGDDFSSGQWAILAALGISNAPGRF